MKIDEAVRILEEEIDKTMRVRDYLVSKGLTCNDDIFNTEVAFDEVLCEVCEILFGKDFELDKGDDEDG